MRIQQALVFVQVFSVLSPGMYVSAVPGGGSPDPNAVENRRYVEGQELYLRECDPRRVATMVIDAS